MDTGLLLDGDYLGAAVAELKGDIAVDVDGAFTAYPAGKQCHLKGNGITLDADS